MAWLLLVIAGLLEVTWAVGLKYTEGFSRLWPSVVTIGAMAVVMSGVWVCRQCGQGVITAGTRPRGVSTDLRRESDPCRPTTGC